MPMTEGQILALQTELDEVNAQMAEMVGSPAFSVGGFSVDESKLLDDLTKRKTSLEWRLSNTSGGPMDTVRVIQPGGNPGTGY